MGLLKNYEENGTVYLNLKYKDFDANPYIQKDIGANAGDKGLSMEFQKRVDDLQRITKLFTRKPGLKYIANETLLRQGVNSRKLTKSVVKVDRDIIDGKGLDIDFNKVKEKVVDEAVSTAKIIGSTLAQIPINQTGTHFVKGFAGDKGYVGKFGAVIAKDGGTVGVSEIPSRLKETANEYQERKNGKSNVKDANKKKDEHIELQPYKDQISRQKELARKRLGVAGTTTDELSNKFIQSADPNKPVYKLTEKEAQDIRKEKRVNLGDQGKRPINSEGRLVSYGKQAEKQYVDKINSIPPTARLNKTFGPGDARDLIKFRVHVGGTVLYWRAYLTDFSDAYRSTWNAHRYIGRGENFHTYGGFERAVSVSFKIAASTQGEMAPIYEKIRWLASSTAPGYIDNTFMSGTISKLTVGNYLNRVPGFISSVEYRWQQGYPWEIALNEPEAQPGDIEMQELPMVLDCSLQFTPIHTFVPERGGKPYISNIPPLNDLSKDLGRVRELDADGFEIEE